MIIKSFEINKIDPLKNNLMSKFENSIKDDNQKKSTHEKETLSKSSRSRVTPSSCIARF